MAVKVERRDSEYTGVTENRHLAHTNSTLLIWSKKKTRKKQDEKKFQLSQ